MKIKVLGICLLLVFLVGCGQESVTEDGEESMEPNDSMITTSKEDNESRFVLNSGDLEQITDEVVEVVEKNYWEKADCPFSHDCVVEAETAICITQSLLKQFQKEGFFTGYSPQMVEYQADPGIWVVVFWKDSNNLELTPTFNIAIRKDNAQVVKMWVDE